MVKETNDNPNIVDTVRDVAGLNDESFDSEVLVYLNMALIDLQQNGITKLKVITRETTWEEIEPVVSDVHGPVRSYLGMFVKFMIDPPPPSVVSVMKNVLDTTLYRLSLDYDLREVEE